MKAKGILVLLNKEADGTFLHLLIDVNTVITLKLT